MGRSRDYSPTALQAAEMLGGRIRLARTQLRWTAEDFAERIGVTRGTLRKIERGDPTVSVGIMFEAATLAGVPLFHADDAVRGQEAARVREALSLLPQRVRKLSEVDDDF
jgi:transcriptional regulator with XRE-family HTH domain